MNRPALALLLLTALGPAMAQTESTLPKLAARDFQPILTERAIARLNPEAVLIYAEAQEYYEIADRDNATRKLAEAARVNGDNVDLQFVALANSIRRGEIHYGARAIEFFRLADEITKRLLIMQNLTPEDRDRAVRADFLLNGRPNADGVIVEPGALQNVLQRDQERLATGLGLVLEIHNERVESRGLPHRNERNALRAILNPTEPPKAIAVADDPLFANEILDPFALLPGEVRNVVMPGQQAGPGGLPAPGGAADPFAAGATPPAEGGFGAPPAAPPTGGFAPPPTGGFAPPPPAGGTAPPAI